MSESPTRSYDDTASAARVGRFTYWPSTDSWIWSDGMYRIHGIPPRSVAPTTDLVMMHMHPEDRAAAWAALERAIALGNPFTFPHRIINTAGDLRVVIAAGHSEPDDDEVVRLVGHLVDISGFSTGAVISEVDLAVADFKANRAVIEQAKGVLMQLYSVDAEVAWQMLGAYSQNHNQKVRELAEVVVEAAAEGRSPSKDQRGKIHDVLDQMVADQPEQG